MSITVSVVNSKNNNVAISYQPLDVDDTTALTLTVPEGANSAIISVEGDATAADSTKVIRFLENGDTPTAVYGMPLGNGDVYEIKTYNNLKNFKVIGIEAGKTHTLNVTYYY